MKSNITQLRAEIESDRNDRWKADNDRNQWAADLRAAVVKSDASVDSKINSHLERLHSKLMMDKMETMRYIEEHRELIAGSDFKRVSSQMAEFSRINDHLLALERWTNTEFGHIKRIFQWITTDIDSRFQALVAEMMNGMKHWNIALTSQEEDTHNRIQDLHDAILEISQLTQRKLFALEEVVPLEVKARQQNDEKLRKRFESALKSLSRAMEASRDEGGTGSLVQSLTSRMKNLENAQRLMLEEAHTKQERAEESLQCFLRGIEDKLQERIAAAVVSIGNSRTDTGSAASSRQIAADSTLNEQVLALMHEPQLESAPTETSSTPEASIEMFLEAARSEWTLFFTAQTCVEFAKLLHPLIEEWMARHNELAAHVSRIEHEHTATIAGLQGWMTGHAEECRQCYDFLNWSIEAMQTQSTVKQVLTAVVDQIADCGSVYQEDKPTSPPQMPLLEPLGSHGDGQTEDIVTIAGFQDSRADSSC